MFSTIDCNPIREDIYCVYGVRCPCGFHVFLYQFHLRWMANANTLSSGIWALNVLGLIDIVWS